ncbi:MAG: DUF1844 domain-containing protein [Nitrospirota bacterium]
MTNEEERSFTVRDKRIKIDEEQSEKHIKDEAAVSKKKDSAPEVDETHENREKPPHPVTFSGFIISLATSALIYLGEEENPATKRRDINLPQAKEMVDIIEVLEKKTKGNLTSEEENLLRNLLFTLRMKYVERSKD